MSAKIDDLPVVSELKFRFANQRALFTYSDHLDKSLIREVFESMDAKRVEIAHETGETGHKHTHVYVDFGRVYDIRNQRHFDIEGHHPNIRKVKTSIHVNNVLNYLAKEDPENTHLAEPKTLFDKVCSRESVQELMRLVVHPAEATGLLAMWNQRAREELENSTELKGWQVDLKDQLLTRDNNRQLIWMFDRTGGAGKSVFCQYMEDVFNCLLITQMGGSRDLATVIKNAIEIDGWNNGIILVDLPRKAETKAIYEPLEMVLNGRMTAVKYQGGRLRWRTRAVVVFANFPPAVVEMSLDRWDIREIVRDVQGNLNIKNRFPLDFQFMLPE